MKLEGKAYVAEAATLSPSRIVFLGVCFATLPDHLLKRHGRYRFKLTFGTEEVGPALIRRMKKIFQVIIKHEDDSGDCVFQYPKCRLIRRDGDTFHIEANRHGTKRGWITFAGTRPGLLYPEWFSPEYALNAKVHLFTARSRIPASAPPP